jgi:hypothetical protein
MTCYRVMCDRPHKDNISKFLGGIQEASTKNVKIQTIF